MLFQQQQQQRIGYCAILLVIVFGIVAFLSFIYLYLYCSQLKEEQNALKTRTAEFVRAEQVPAIIQQSESVLRLQDSLQQINLQQDKNMTSLEKRMQALLSLGQKQQQLFDALNERRQDATIPSAAMRMRHILPQEITTTNPNNKLKVSSLSSLSSSSSGSDDEEVRKIPPNISPNISPKMEIVPSKIPSKISSKNSSIIPLTSDEEEENSRQNQDNNNNNKSQRRKRLELVESDVASSDYYTKKLETMSMGEQERRLAKKLARKAKAKLLL